MESKPGTEIARRDADTDVVFAEDASEDPTMNKQPLEVYMYYAAIERAREAADPRPIPDAPWTVLWKKMTGRRDRIAYPPQARVASSSPSSGGKGGGRWSLGLGLRRRRGRGSDAACGTSTGSTGETSDHVELDEKLAVVTHHDSKHADDADADGVAFEVTPEERESAYRLLRVASWQVVFFLIMTDVLGWYTAPMAFSQLGYGPGVLVYTCFFLLAFGSGQILWRMYLTLDSERYPVKCYADLGERTYGPVAKHAVTILQSIQLLFNTAMLIVMDGMGLSQIIDFKACSLALCLGFAALCCIGSQIKTLRNLGWLTNVNLFINTIVCTLTMIGVALYDPVPSQSGHADLSEPIIRSGWVPSYTLGWYQQMSGMQLAVFAYGGAMIFTEFMAEMRRPRDFWKSALLAQGMCWLFYMVFGIFVYSFQGQYSNILPTVNIASRLFQGLTNILGLICVCIIAILYANIGCKVIYRNILRGYFHAPSLATRKSTPIWLLLTVVYWAVAWALGSAIPNVQDLNTVVGAVCIMSFTMSCPPFFLLGHWVQLDACKGDNAWEPGMEPWSNRVDSWREWSRWKRGFGPYWYLKFGLIIYVLGALTISGLGVYAGVVSFKHSFDTGFTIAYSCRAPGQPQ